MTRSEETVALVVFIITMLILAAVGALLLAEWVVSEIESVPIVGPMFAR
jgi:hypothetical protein